MPKPACVQCKRFYRPEKNGVYVLEQAPNGSDVPPGTAAEQDWHPYKIWQADLWKCHGCGHQMITGYGLEPTAEHYQKDRFEKFRSLVTHTVNDC